MQPTANIPVSLSDRADILDILRGIALLGICLANYPALSMYVFQKQEVLNAMPTASFDKILDFFHFVFIDGKFYTLFSLLFGIGFSIILLRSQQKGKGLGIFYRRIIILIFIGLAHALFLWEGDILLLYGIIGLLLPLFRNVSDRKLLILIVVLILMPIVIDSLKVISKGVLDLSKPMERLAMAADDVRGITDENWMTWHVDHTTYAEMFKMNQAAIFWRYQDLLANNRFFKVLGIFLLGLVAGRKLLYRKLEENKTLFKKLQRYGFAIGLPFSLGMVYFQFDAHHLPSVYGLLDTVTYALSVVPLSLAYTATICLWFLKENPRKKLLIFAAPGRMALTNYLMQTMIAILIFYGVGLGYGATLGLVYVIFIAISVYLFQMLFSNWWLNHFNYGPFEWIWRQLTYGKKLPLRKTLQE